MATKKNRATILTIGDRADYDSYRKFHKERSFVTQSGFEYVSVNYKQLFTRGLPPIRTDRVIVFLFFPFVHWNTRIEHKKYRGVYGNRTFYNKFSRFWEKTEEIVRDSLAGKELFFVNKPSLCGLYRDKFVVSNMFARSRIPSPRLYSVSRIRSIEHLLDRGHALFVKPRYGSMGKGITYLSWSNWQTNFIFGDDAIISRRSDHGWKFRDITKNRRFLSKLIKKDVIIEAAVDSIVVKQMKIDMRVYVFFNRVLYIYPRKNRIDSVTTNISQGGRGDPALLEVLPKRLVTKARKAAVRVSKLLGLNLVGMDIMLDRNLKDISIVDVNVFPGFPKRKTFNLALEMARILARVNRRGDIRYEKGGRL